MIDDDIYSSGSLTSHIFAKNAAPERECGKKRKINFLPEKTGSEPIHWLPLESFTKHKKLKAYVHNVLVVILGVLINEIVSIELREIVCLLKRIEKLLLAKNECWNIWNTYVGGIFNENTLRTEDKLSLEKEVFSNLFADQRIHDHHFLEECCWAFT